MESDYVEKALYVDPQVDLDYDSPPEEIIRKGPVDKTVYPIGASNWTNNNLGFQNISPATLTTVTSREFNVKYDILVGVQFPKTGNNNDPANYYPYTPAVAANGVPRAWPLANDGSVVAPNYVAGQLAYDPAGKAAAGGANAGNSTTSFCLRAWPLQSALSSLELFLNGNSISIPQNDLICLQPYLMSNEEIEYYASSFPCQRDDGASYNVVSDNDNNRTPFANFSMNVATQSRSSFLSTLIYENLTGDVVSRVYKWSITEALCMSPLVWGKCQNAEGLANITNISFNMTIQNINRCLSSYAFPGLSATPATVVMTASIAPLTFNGQSFTVEQPQFLPTYLTQDPVLSARMGSKLLYDYDQLLVDANSNAITTQLGSGSDDGVWNGNALRSNVIPDEILVYIKPRKGTTNHTVPDNFVRIKSLSMQIGNRASVFATFKEEDLHKMTVRNGVKLSSHEWKYGVGSIIKISVPSDVGLISDEASGQTKFTMIKIDGAYSCSNLTYSNAGNQFYDVMTVLVTNGKAEISPGTAVYKVGGVTSTDVLALTTSQNNVVTSGVEDNVSSRGGSMFNKIGRLLHKGLSYAKHVKPEHIDMVEKGLGSLGLGGAVTGGEVAGGKLLKRKHKRVL